MNNKKVHRRNFIQQLSVLGLSAGVSSSFLASQQIAAQSESDKGSVILFQGDSITDGNRSRNNDWNHVMGHGYQFIIASKLWYEMPKKELQFFNRGISGNKVTDLAARWNDDALALQPDVLSILVGINDLEAFLKGDSSFSVEHYEQNYNHLLERTKQALPNIQLVLCEPFILPLGRVKEKQALYEKEIKMRQEVVRSITGKYNAIFVPFQDAFNKALQKAPPEYWIWDGIHPMPAGHELMAREWLKQVSSKISFLKSSQAS